MSTLRYAREGRYRIEWNAAIKKWQIKIPVFNVAIGEFYDNSTSSREEITKMFEAIAGISDPATAIANAVESGELLEALKECLAELRHQAQLPPGISFSCMDKAYALIARATTQKAK